MKTQAFFVLIVLLAIPFVMTGQTPAPQAPPVPAGQAPAAAPQPSPEATILVEYMRPLKYDGVTLNLVHINERTVPILFQPPALYSWRARARQGTFFYVQGTPQKDIEVSTAFTIVQNGETIASTASSMRNFVTGKVASGQRIDGVLEFAKKVDVTKPFTIKHGKGDVEFVLSEAAIKALTPQ